MCRSRGAGLTLLLPHGTGGATHSWRGLGPLLAARFTIVAPDLPGHGFTETPADTGMSLPGMAGLMAVLLRELGVAPVGAVGRSAGAAVAVRMALDGALPDARARVAIAGALLPFPGFAQTLFPGLAKLLFVNPIVPRLFTLGAGSDAGVAGFLARASGSAVRPEYAADYARLFRAHGRVAGVLGMMASWGLAALERALLRLAVPLTLTLIVGEGDAAVPPSVAARVAQAVSHASVRSLAGLGHLAHEEAPDEVAAIVTQAVEGTG